MENRALEELMDELSAARGGSLAEHVYKGRITNGGTLLIGLGGLGCKTVNAVKRLYRQQCEPSESIRFLAVDTDEGELKELDWLEPDEEELSLFDREGKDKLLRSDWVWDVVDGMPRFDPLDDILPRDPRISRALLLCTGMYAKLKARITELVRKLQEKQHTVNMILVTGLSGETGGGMFLDVAYMLRSVREEIFGTGNDSGGIWGVLYTPEVQLSVPAVREDRGRLGWMRKNAREQFRKLDYCMSHSSVEQGARPIYQVSFPDGAAVASAKPVFDERRVFVVSGNGADDQEQILEDTAQWLLEVQMDAENAGSVYNMFSNTESLYVWRMQHEGRPGPGVGAPMFPAGLHYLYGALGSRTVRIPVNGIMAGLADGVMRRVNAFWKSEDRLDQAELDRWMDEAGLGSAGQLVGVIKDVMGVTADELRIDEHDDPDAWPEVTRSVLGVGYARGTYGTMSRALRKADAVFERIAAPEKIDRVAEQLVLRLTGPLSSEDFMRRCGPYAAVAALTGCGDIRGCFDKLQQLQEECRGFFSVAETSCEQSRAAMEQMSLFLEKHHRLELQEIDMFINACRDFSRAYLDSRIARLLPDVIRKLGARLAQYSSETFQLYLPVLEALTDMLERDTAALWENAAWSEETRRRFETLFRNCADDAAVDMLAGRFVHSMTGDRAVWERWQYDPQTLAGEIRGIFRDFLGPFAGDMQEKFAVLAYACDLKDEYLTPEGLQRLWDAANGTPEAQLRDTALLQAAQEIACALADNSVMQIAMTGGAMMQRGLVDQSVVRLPMHMPKLGKCIRMTLDRYGFAYSDEGRFRAVRALYPVALPLVKGLEKLAEDGEE